MSAVTMNVPAVLACGDGAWGAADGADAAVGQVASLETDAMAFTGLDSSAVLASVGRSWTDFMRSCAGTTREIGNKLKSSGYTVEGADGKSTPAFDPQNPGASFDGTVKVNLPETGTAWVTGAQ